MANTVYENFILESKITDLLNTKMAVRNFMTVDDSLAEAPGMIKKINTYTYTGKAEKVGKGQKNTTRGAVSYTTKQYEVEVTQQVFDYYDEEAMQDPKLIDIGMDNSANEMVNDMNRKFFAELAKATSIHQVTGALKYDDIVDAIQLMNLEDENGLFLIIGNDLKAEIRKDPDFKSAKQGEILFTGHIGSISGVPVVYSALAPKDTAFLATKAAVTLFVKKESEVEQDRDKEARLNTIIMRKVNLVALTDATKVVKITKAASK